VVHIKVRALIADVMLRDIAPIALQTLMRRRLTQKTAT